MAKKGKNLAFYSGNEAVAHGALYAGCDFFAGYPITPSTEVAEIMALEQPKRGGSFIQMEDEIASMAAIVGGAIAGAKSMTATSGPGFSLMQENLGYAAMIEAPCVVVNVMRGGPSTGLPTKVAQGDVMQARWGTHGDHPIIALSPESVLECFTLTVEAFNLAERFRSPVVLLADEMVGHMSEVIRVPEPGELAVVERETAERPAEWYKPFELTAHGPVPLIPFGEGYRYHVTGLTHDEQGFPTNRPDECGRMLSHLCAKLDQHPEIRLVERVDLEDAEVAVIAYGCTARTMRRTLYAARREGVKAGMLRLKTVWPFPEAAVDQVCDEVDLVLVPELNLGQLVGEVERVNRGRARVLPVNRADGEILNPYDVADTLVKCYHGFCEAEETEDII
ncbi:MAG TPA: 2-oxoacid:acceptor oxidoreductase subunit alpha [Candidatus Coatesbacteria bacterium]|nr:2-oxoacid:acceptor oxidoreductase subunit alpha [Candidatus Coatesbacteria bacterium]